jgi:hypothetical protein
VMFGSVVEALEAPTYFPFVRYSGQPPSPLGMDGKGSPIGVREMVGQGARGKSQ